MLSFRLGGWAAETMMTDLQSPLLQLALLLGVAHGFTENVPMTYLSDAAIDPRVLLRKAAPSAAANGEPRLQLRAASGAARPALASALAAGKEQAAGVRYPSAGELREFLRSHMPTEAEFPRVHTAAKPGSQTPASHTGRTLYALATHPALNKILVYFMGYPGANGVYCLAKGLERKFKRTGVKGTVITADTNGASVREFQALLRKEGLLQFVDVRHAPMDLTHPLYSGKVDLFAEDMDGATALEALDFVLKTCRPEVYHGENTKGIGSNHAFKADYGAEIGADHVVEHQSDSKLDDMAGRGFSVFVKPYDMLFADIRARHRAKDLAAAHGTGTHQGCSKPLTEEQRLKLVTDYTGWGVATAKLAKEWKCTREHIWNIVTCQQRTLCAPSCPQIDDCAE